MAKSKWDIGKFDRKVNTITRARLVKVGIFVEGEAKDRAPVGIYPGARVGGNLRDSITYEVIGNKSVRIGSNVEYAPFVELGTERMDAQPFLQPAVLENKSAILRLLDIQK